ncbi:hypothetical protein DFA_08468 [Cavenderia fasciculata]|uniref:AB hydrolase-1 domain-containing protein n=1 Tax=Cavenderia fasciculata TaxID=261658 RepID=F4Q698_CACFS|nr:uncharacterized protein DFA_08468 [Cavenderia fasciculata]EGG17472.1 hypothetical protein DFA_08468 [Cavenderia fasciculata]|eukprot:XP_004355956.1 hypothetical protein DFA_08468 [Cavenderia fasciculata]
MINHGSSLHFSEMGLNHLVEDLHGYLKDKNILKNLNISYGRDGTTTTKQNRLSIVGHSVGGKVGALYSLYNPHLVDGLVCVDVAMTSYVGIHNHNSKFEAMIKASETFSDPTTSRQSIESIMESYHLDKGERLYLLNNLVESTNNNNNGPKFKWRINLKTLYKHQNELLSFPDKSSLIYNYSQDLEDPSSTTPTFKKPVLFIGGSESHYLKSPHSESIGQYFPQHSIEFIKGGHFSHAQSPRSFMNEQPKFLNPQVSKEGNVQVYTFQPEEPELYTYSNGVLTHHNKPEEKDPQTKSFDKPIQKSFDNKPTSSNSPVLKESLKKKQDQEGQGTVLGQASKKGKSKKDKKKMDKKDQLEQHDETKPSKDMNQNGPGLKEIHRNPNVGKEQYFTSFQKYVNNSGQDHQ